MGYGWRRVTEAVRQKVVMDKTFKATSNARNEAMFKEATDFCAHLKQLEKDLRSLHREIEVNFTNLRVILQAPLPRAYEEGQPGVAVACSEGDPKQIGQGIPVDALVQCAQELRGRLEEEVIKPLKHWYHAYKNIAERMVKLEEIRLELDSRRRTVDTLLMKLDKLRNAQSGNNRDKMESEIDKLAMLVQHKQIKLERTIVTYREQEQTVFNSLNTLIKDTGVLRDYAGLSLSVVQDCYQNAYNTFKTASPMPEYNSTSDNLFNQAPYHEQMPIAEKVKSERAMMVRQMSERPQRAAKDSDKATVYAVSDDGGSADPGYDQTKGGNYGYDLPVSTVPIGNQGNPYATAASNPYSAYAQNSPGRYVAPPGQAAWQGNAF